MGSSATSARFRTPSTITSRRGVPKVCAKSRPEEKAGLLLVIWNGGRRIHAKQAEGTLGDIRAP